MKSCDICKKTIRFRKFKYSDGYVCPECYKIASRNFSETIVKMSYDEIIDRYNEDKKLRMDNEKFEITKRIGNFLLIDKKHRKICIPHNRAITKEYKYPEVYKYDDILDFRIDCGRKIKLKELDELIKNSSKDSIIEYLNISIKLKSKSEVCKIKIIPTPVRINSYAFRRAYDFVKNIMLELEQINIRKVI